MGLEGTLFVGFVVNRHGAIYDVSVVESSGHPTLDKEAIHIFRTGKYAPGRIDGIPSNICAVYKVIFRLGP